jgi:hypothetical protein
MSWNKPEWYMTTDEFAALVVEALESTNHFKRGELVHPEDIVGAFVTVAEAIGIGAGAAGKKMWAAEKKAVMTTDDLKKNDDRGETTEVGQDEVGYSEWKNKVFK